MPRLPENDCPVPEWNWIVANIMKRMRTVRTNCFLKIRVRYAALGRGCTGCSMGFFWPRRLRTFEKRIEERMKETAKIVMLVTKFPTRMSPIPLRLGKAVEVAFCRTWPTSGALRTSAMLNPWGRGGKLDKDVIPVKGKLWVM